jgi:hypothetical protein
MIIEGTGLWCKAVCQKCIKPLFMEECIISPIKYIHNVSVIWKFVVTAFPLRGNWLVWKVGDVNKVRP